MAARAGGLKAARSPHVSIAAGAGAAAAALDLPFFIDTLTLDAFLSLAPLPLPAAPPLAPGPSASIILVACSFLSTLSSLRLLSASTTLMPCRRRGVVRFGIAGASPGRRLGGGWARACVCVCVCVCVHVSACVQLCAKRFL